MSATSDNRPDTSQPPGALRVWVLAARPATLPAAVVPVLVGSAVAYAAGAFQVLALLAALLAATFIQIGTNLANDYFDYHKGADTAARIGPVRVTQSGLIAPARVRAGMIVTFALAALAGLYLVFVGGWPIFVIGVLSITAGVLYTGGPWPLGYNGLGDLFVFIFFGLVAVTATTYLHTGLWSLAAFVNSLPVAMLVTAIIVVNNLRDADTDRMAGKHTLAVLFGKRFARIEYATLVLGAYLLLPVSWQLGLAPAWALLPWLTLPLALPLVRTMLRDEGPVLNKALKGTGQLHLLFGVLFAMGLAL